MNMILVLSSDLQSQLYTIGPHQHGCVGLLDRARAVAIDPYSGSLIAAISRANRYFNLIVRMRPRLPAQNDSPSNLFDFFRVDYEPLSCFVVRRLKNSLVVQLVVVGADGFVRVYR